MQPTRTAPTFVLWLAGMVLAGCDASTGRSVSNFRGVVIQPPIEKPDFVLTDVEGKPFNFRLATAGKVTLLFFGYTYCPDVCPLHAANVAAVLRQMPFEERDAIRFVFVTTDPDRDTPARLKEWLGNFDSSFIGLSGPLDEVNRIQAGLQMAPAQRDPTAKDSADYLVGHAAQVLAFGTDGYARVEYPFGVRQEDWANDLPRLVRGEVPPAARVDSRATAEPPPAPLVETAIMPRPASSASASVYVTLRNLVPDDTLVALWSAAAERVSIHETRRSGQSIQMVAIDRLVVPGTGVLPFAPGALHLMVNNLRELPAVGQSIPFTLRFARGGDVVFAATVVEYADVERLLAPKEK